MKQIVYGMMLVSVVHSCIFGMYGGNWDIDINYQDIISKEEQYKIANAEMSDGFFPLSVVKKLDTCKLLLDWGAKPNQINKYGNTPFGHVVMNATTNAEIMELLLQHGASPNTFFDGHPLLHHVIQLGFVDKVHALLGAGARVSQDTLTLASESQNADIIQLVNRTTAIRVMHLIDEAIAVSKEHKNNENIHNLLSNNPWMFGVCVENNWVGRVCQLLERGVSVPDYIFNKLNQNNPSIDYGMSIVLRFYISKNGQHTAPLFSNFIQ
jgi:ankyrin repeat protein